MSVHRLDETLQPGRRMRKTFNCPCHFGIEQAPILTLLFSNFKLADVVIFGGQNLTQRNTFLQWQLRDFGLRIWVFVFSMCTCVAVSISACFVTLSRPSWHDRDEWIHSREKQHHHSSGLAALLLAVSQLVIPPYTPIHSTTVPTNK